MKIILVGPMAAGKTYLGKILAQKLGLSFIDTDAWVEQQAGRSVVEIFNEEGEPAFRDWETRALKTLMAQENCVIATGGGIIKKSKNRILMSESVVVYLDVAIETQLIRTAGDATRPLLLVPNREAKLKQLREERDSLYREVADLIVDANQTPTVILEMILKYLQSALTG